MATHGLEASVLVFAISLLVGGLGIHLGSKLVLKAENFSHAVLTALLGALAWAAVDIAFGRLGIEGLLAAVVGLLVWIWVIRWRYAIGWLRASLLGFGAWIGALVVVVLLAILGIGGLEAYGVPGA